MTGEPEQSLRVSKIPHGTVIDHVPGGQALNILTILDIDGTGGETVSIGMNVPSDRLPRKDVVKIEDRELSQNEVDVLSLIAPDATINIIRDYDVQAKRRVERPDRVTGAFACPTSSCITNQDEPIEPTFDVVTDGVRCIYCETIIREDLADHVTR